MMTSEELCRMLRHFAAQGRIDSEVLYLAADKLERFAAENKELRRRWSERTETSRDARLSFPPNVILKETEVYNDE